MVFTLGTLDGITLASLVVALIALGVTLSAYYVTRKQMGDLRSIDKSIDAYAVVQEFSQRSKKLEERLIDQKVRLEILELRQQRGGITGRRELEKKDELQEGEREREEQVVASYVPISHHIEPIKAPLLQERKIDQAKHGVDLKGRGGGEEQQFASSQLVRSEIEALRVVLEAGQRGASAKQIQARIGRSREHTARMMNSLFKQGLVERNAEARPFTYTITERGKSAI